MRGSHFEVPPAEYERLRSGHFQRRRVDLVAAAVDRYVARGGTIAEIGCGPGAILAELAGRRPDATFIGVDSEPEMVRHASAAHVAANLNFVLGLVGRDRVHATVDFVFAIDVLHHVRDPDSFLSAVAVALLPGGRVLAIEPNSLHPYVRGKQERMRRAGLDEDHFRPRRWEPAFRAAGFVIEAKTYLHALPALLRTVPARVAAIERAVERVPFLAGSIVYRLRL